MLSRFGLLLSPAENRDVAHKDLLYPPRTYQTAVLAPHLQYQLPNCFIVAATFEVADGATYFDETDISELLGVLLDWESGCRFDPLLRV